MNKLICEKLLFYPRFVSGLPVVSILLLGAISDLVQNSINTANPGGSLFSASICSTYFAEDDTSLLF